MVKNMIIDKDVHSSYDLKGEIPFYRFLFFPDSQKLRFYQSASGFVN
jgi:hypothetical protein